jgi:hypothetical protein
MKHLQDQFDTEAAHLRVKCLRRKETSLLALFRQWLFAE